MTAFHTVGIIGKQDDAPRVLSTIRRLLTHLSACGCDTRLDPLSAQSLLLPERAMDTARLGGWADLVVVVGGDGTLLHAAREVAPHQTPLLGINLGRLGFLVDVSPECIEAYLDQILGGEFYEDQRCLLEVDSDQRTTLALNDVVIAKWNSVRMIELEIEIDGYFVNSQRSDGLIIATPTGSTAYALSGGGPLLHPALEALVLVPICPHTLSNRPLVISSHSQIALRLTHAPAEQVRITCDGQIELGVPENALIHIRRSVHRLRLLHPRGHDHFAILRAKLGWGGYQHAGTLC